jgi:hypothetical protein
MLMADQASHQAAIVQPSTLCKLSVRLFKAAR